MCSQVWLRFEKEKNGLLKKFRIQDLPPERIEEATELMVKYFCKDEPVRKSLGYAKNPEALEEYRIYIEKIFRESVNLMCCADSADTDTENPVIMGLSSIKEATAVYWDLTANTRKCTPEAKKNQELYLHLCQACDLLKKFKFPSYYSDKSILVLPEYRGYGIAQHFMTVRRIMCAAHGIPMTGGWMTNLASQIAAQRDGWELVHEVSYEELSREYGVVFEDVPPTIKLMVGWPHPDYPAVIQS